MKKFALVFADFLEIGFFSFQTNIHTIVEFLQNICNGKYVF